MVCNRERLAKGNRARRAGVVKSTKKSDQKKLKSAASTFTSRSKLVRPDITPEFVLAAVKKAARQCKGPMTLPDFERISGIGRHYINSRFPDGGWRQVREQA